MTVKRKRQFTRVPPSSSTMAELAELLRGRPAWQLEIVRALVLATLYPPKKP